MKIDGLPDFINLTDDQIKAEQERQDRLRRDFNTRARQTGPELEMSRAMVLEESLREAYKTDSSDTAANQLAENLSLQGRFLEAAGIARNPDAIAFYEKVAAALYYAVPCECENPIEIVGNSRIKLPKFHAVKEVYSIPDSRFVFIQECRICKKWTTGMERESAVRLTPEQLQTAPNDLKRLAV
jgi:hypothetical protein